MESDRYQERLLRLSPLEFEIFLVELLRRTGRFSEVSVSHGPAERGVDIEAVEKESLTRKSRRWLFEVKRTKVAGKDLISRMAGAQVVLRGREPAVEFILVIAGYLTAEAEAAARMHDIRVWDGARLEELDEADLLKDFAPDDSQSSPLSLDRRAEHEAHPKHEAFLDALARVAPGKQDWPAFQRLSSDILEYLFCPPLEAPRYDVPDADARNRRDVIFENPAMNGFWAGLRTTYAAHYIVVDAKNYKAPISKRPVLDIAHYLKPYGCGLFALLVTRRGMSSAAAHAVREQWIGANKMIVALADEDVIEMIRLKADGGRPEEIVRGLIANFRMSL